MKLALVAAVAALPLLASPAFSASYQLDISGSRNVPTFTLTNTSSPSVALTDFTFTIQDPGFNFDFFNNASAPGITSFTVNFLDEGQSTATNNEGFDVTEDRNPVFDVDFTGFDSTEEFSVVLDVDPANANGTSNDNFESVFFNNGPALNALVQVAFADGSSLELTLPDQPQLLATYSFSQSSPSVVPLPAGLPLLLTGLGAVALVRRRRQ